VGRNVCTRVSSRYLTALLIVLSLLSIVCAAQPTSRSLLIVASDEIHLDSIGHAELRKIFLGVPVTKDEVRIRPLLNETDTRATSIFLQQVIFMSEREYKRRLISRVFRLGDQRPQEYDDLALLVEQLRESQGSVSFMWSDQLENYDGLKSLGVIWTGSAD